MLKWIQGELEHPSTMNIISIIIEADITLPFDHATQFKNEK